MKPTTQKILGGAPWRGADVALGGTHLLLAPHLPLAADDARHLLRLLEFLRGLIDSLQGGRQETALAAGEGAPRGSTRGAAAACAARARLRAASACGRPPSRCRLRSHWA